MGINKYKIKKWFKMLTGKSILHVEQGMGKFFIPGEIHGYYNDLTNKVLLDKEALDGQKLPVTYDDNGKQVIFATTIFQYGLGCYDLILQTNEEIYKSQFKHCLDWAVKNQDANGGWNISEFAGDNSPYGSMAQGEGVSLLLRGYVLFKESIYLDLAKKAIDLMISPLEKGGTARYFNGKEVVFMEFMDTPCVLNGWIFSLFGLYDFLIVNNDSRYSEIYAKSISTLKEYMDKFDNQYWSNYNEKGMVSSPFYHKLHIAQLSAIELIDSDDTWKTFKNRFINYQQKKLNRIRAFYKKVFQKLFTKNG